jgi:two-component system, NtrC family, response regulator AtoC
MGQRGSGQEREAGMARILVVDDEADVIQYLSDELRAAGYDTGGASDGVEAVLKVLDGGWDAVLMDIRMPNLNGINALKIIRRIAPQMVVLMFTGQAGQGDMYETTRLGAFTCLLKPVAVGKLLDALQQALKVNPA